MSKKNISEDSIDVFSWQRHGELETVDHHAEKVNKNLEGGFLNDYFVGQSDFLKGKIVLDAGCGGGDKTCSLAISSGAKLVIGVDGSESAIAAANDLKEEINLENVIFVKGRMEDMPDILRKEFDIESVDFIFNSFNLHHVEDYPGLLSTFSNLLRPGGVLLTIYVTMDRGGGSFVLKNRIAYGLGKDKPSRMKIGRFLFSRFDKEFNIQKAKVDQDSFDADRYSAFYRVMRPGAVIRNLREVGFEIVETKPPLRAYDFLFKRPTIAKAQILVKATRMIPFGEFFLTVALRAHQFLRNGDTRAFLCIKTSRPNIRNIIR